MTLRKTWEEEQVPPGGREKCLLETYQEQRCGEVTSNGAFGDFKWKRVYGMWWLLEEANRDQVGRAWKAKLKA